MRSAGTRFSHKRKGKNRLFATRQDQTNTLPGSIRETCPVTKALPRKRDCTEPALIPFLADNIKAKTTIPISGIKARQIPNPGHTEGQPMQWTACWCLCRQAAGYVN
ncbi:hypothetical protein [Solidesulfovibrio magneticus]|uniref:hypothetical protein n=1 Tax=Solidesulfovibrio magneticus TaxID=184917 RepID=UPI0011D0DAA8|nr:hypothetical protein [Solidesulfovibrio magneticus]